LLLLSLLLSWVLLVLATPAAAQTDPDPCFDISVSKSQYEACTLDPGGNSGSGGSTPPPPCMSCVTGDDGNGNQISSCKDSNVYLPSWPQYSGCRTYVYCWPGPFGFPLCETGCSGNACLRI
jgi:hypothetical protein